MCKGGGDDGGISARPEIYREQPPFFTFIFLVENAESSLPTRTDGQREKRMRVKGKRERGRETEYYHRRTAHGVTAAHTFVLSGVQKCVRKEACWMYTNSDFV